MTTEAASKVMTSGNVGLRVYYARRRSDAAHYERYHEVNSPEQAFTLLMDSVRFNPINRIDRVIMWASWLCRKRWQWTGTSEAFALGPFKSPEDLDAAIGQLWIKTVEKAGLAGCKIVPADPVAIYYVETGLS